MSGAIIVDGSTASPTRTLRTAAASRGRNVGSSYTGAVRIARLAAEHFWPACPNAERTMSRIAASMSADSVTTTAFLPLVSASRRSDGFQSRNSCAVA